MGTGGDGGGGGGGTVPRGTGTGNPMSSDNEVNISRKSTGEYFIVDVKDDVFLSLIHI